MSMAHGTGARAVAGTTAVLALPGARHAARHHVVAGAGHMITMEQPGAVNDLLIQFLDQLSTP